MTIQERNSIIQVMAETLSGASFGIAIEEDGVPVLGVLVEDIPAITSIEWKNAAIIRNFRKRDWIALSCPSAGQDEAGEDVQVRLFLPLAGAIADAFENSGVAQLRIRAMKIQKGKPVVAKGQPRAELPLSLKGFQPKLVASKD